MTYKGLVWRYIPKDTLALDYRYLLLANGRWNRFGVYGCLYTALTREGAEAEYRKILQTYKIRPDQDAPKELVSIYEEEFQIKELYSRSYDGSCKFIY